MEIKAADVMKLRKMTGAGMMDCKKALMKPKVTLHALRTLSARKVSSSLPSVPTAPLPRVSSLRRS